MRRHDRLIPPKGIKIPDRDMKDLERRVLHRHDFHGEWNYNINPDNTTPPASN